MTPPCWGSAPNRTPPDRLDMIASVSDSDWVCEFRLLHRDPANAPALAGYTDYLRVLLTLTGVP